MVRKEAGRTRIDKLVINAALGAVLALLPSRLPWGEPLSYVVMAILACSLPVLVVLGISRKTPRNPRRHEKAERARMQRQALAID